MIFGVSQENGGQKAVTWIRDFIGEVLKYRKINKPSPKWGTVLDTNDYIMTRRSDAQVFIDKSFAASGLHIGTCGGGSSRKVLSGRLSGGVFRGKL